MIMSQLGNTIYLTKILVLYIRREVVVAQWHKVVTVTRRLWVNSFSLKRMNYYLLIF